MTNDAFPIVIADDTEVVSEQQLLKQVEDGSTMLSAESVRYIIVHCTATRCNTSYTEKQLLRDHRARGFRTVGYHFYIRRDGTLTQHRRLLDVGAHCRPYNRCSVGVCYEGGLDASGRPADTRTPEQRQRMKRLIGRLRILFPQAAVRGHRDMPGATPKECPCFDVEDI